MTSLISSNSRKSNQISNISFFTTTKLYSKNHQQQQHFNSIRLIESSISKLIFSPKLRYQITNFVFFVAFSSSCLCVGVKSIFPNYGFHSNSKSNQSIQESSSSSLSASSFDLLRSLWKSSNSIDQHHQHHLPIYQNLLNNETNLMNCKKQRRWIEEESP